jgi:uncharacterized protein YceK
MRYLLLLLATSSALLASGCGVLIGNIKPVDQKAQNYGISDLSKENPAVWTKLDQVKIVDSSTTDEATTATEISDAAYQSKKNASIISVNSACRQTPDEEEHDLRSLTNLLFLGLSDASQRDEKELTIQNTPALETTIKGKLNGELMMFQAVVLRRGLCIYDLVYMSRPAHFDEHEQDFSHFIASLKLK